MLADVSLDDKFTLERGRVMISGTQALTRVLMAQRRADMRRGLNTGGFISGYRGSPLGSLDTALWAARRSLDELGIVFQPGLNEELAATAVYGTQQLGFVDGATRDGVVAAWYGKGPGVDRAGDALKHGNLAGTARLGGVLVYAGDDHAAKSSTTAHQSEQALVASLIPVLYPASVAEFLEFGAFGIALSRYSGLWAGFKCVNDTADATATAELGDPARVWSMPTDFELPAQGLNIIKGESQLDMERRTVDFRLPAAQAFARANGFDRITRGGARRSLAIVTAGRAALDVMEALDQLQLDEGRCRDLGIRVLKLGMTWPVEPQIVRDFATGHRALLVVEDKRAFIEPQVASILYHLPADRRPALIGKADEGGQPLLPQHGELNPGTIRQALMRTLEPLGLVDERLQARWVELQVRSSAAGGGALTEFNRMPFFCSGCPHNSSTVVPTGAVALSGIGCHVMAAMMPHRLHLWPVQMGGEGANWIGMAPFTATPHVFQNLGDGTYHHSGSLAIRAAIGAGVNITYKLLFNDAVAMTGGQPVESQLMPWQIAHELLQEGVAKVTVVADDPRKYPSSARFPDGVSVRPREELELVQRELSAISGVTVLIYDQVCAAEKRRRRKRREFPDPPTRVFINDLVCEGCGACSAKSNCVSVQPLETEFGRKRLIDQSNCNKDYSCTNGFCPSFVTVHGAEVAARSRRSPSRGATALPELPAPLPSAAVDCSILIVGIGGTGVVTVGAVLGMAAHIEGKAVSIVDMTGLSQKNGAVSSHLRIAPTADGIRSARIPAGGADVLLGCDMITAAGAEAMSLIRAGETTGVVNENFTATAAFTIDTKVDFKAAQTIVRLRQVLAGQSVFIDASQVALQLLGDTIGANMLVVGAALQRGLLPVSVAAVERAIELNGVAIEFNLTALRLGRLAVADPGALAIMIANEATPDSAPLRRLSDGLDEVVARRVPFLVDYQNRAYAERYARRVAAVRAAEAKVMPGNTDLADAVARNLFKLMAYKDEYEVARLYTNGEFHAKLKEQFSGPYSLSVHLAPPLLARRDPATGRPRKIAFGGYILGVFRLLAKLKWLRGTALDPFGRTAERRTERRLVAAYEALIDDVVESLTPANHAAAVQLARYPDQIRGFGHVKEANIALAERQRDELLAAYRSSRVVTLEAAE